MTIGRGAFPDWDIEVVLRELAARIDKTKDGEWWVILDAAADTISDLRAAVADAATLDGDGKVGRDHPDTSRHAAGLPVYGKNRWLVLDALHEYPNGTTARVLAKAMGHASPNEIAARLLELRERRLVEFVRDDEGRPLTRVDEGFKSPASVQRVSWFGSQYRAEVLRDRGRNYDR